MTWRPALGAIAACGAIACASGRGLTAQEDRAVVDHLRRFHQAETAFSAINVGTYVEPAVLCAPATVVPGFPPGEVFWCCDASCDAHVRRRCRVTFHPGRPAAHLPPGQGVPGSVATWAYTVEPPGRGTRYCIDDRGVVVTIPRPGPLVGSDGRCAR